jgi:arsenate reductase
VPDRPLDVLYLGNGNAGRSIIAESILNRLAQGKLRAYSAGMRPGGAVHPYALQFLNSVGHDTSALRPKSWHEFAKPGASPFDFIFTISDDTAGEPCPAWPGQPVTGNIAIPDPDAVKGTDAEIGLAFSRVGRMLSQRIGIFTALPVRSLEGMSLRHRGVQRDQAAA